MKQKRNIGMVKRSKVTLKQQAFIFESLSDLIAIGFSVKQALVFIETVSKKNREVVQCIKQSLINGYSLPVAMKFFLSDAIYQQLKIADEHGDIVIGMREISRFIQLRLKQQQKIREVMIYPSFLFGILFIIIFAIKFFILPQTSDLIKQTNGNNWTDYLIWGIVLLVILFGLYQFDLFRNKKMIVKAELLVKIPLVGKIFSNYYEYYLSSNLSLMIKNGLDMKQIVNVFLEFEKETLLYEIGLDMQKGLQKGENIDVIFKKYSFVSNEMIVFLSNGSVKTELSKNLDALGKFCFQNLVKSSGSIIQLIQPLSFAIIGLTIVITYLQMLLPMYDSMKGIY
ncbi:hypothetical protein BGL34_00570 [Fructilactobacillus lindneri]|nr:type II secretion system F family protein [Fructilactobacillus lindneri]ANZ58315.1 hypothetical protein AYR60_06010 [Fructilactobacillus lindneri]ANZ59637.1 hypothetical protein AYR59_06265 [Fructilactobacillus lindneri]POG98579.1 hypothetical protein BGL31_01160 [Fructilactobacillus lindneri]POH03967.1 hypothetical protein BGL32_01100 [Fructilactobacillus lindneri]POH04791.1 hypothetical protein BGL33_00795 [Fructilactobacillus lindneri]